MTKVIIAGENMREQEYIEQYIELLRELLDHLPDSIHGEDCWDWAWEELTDEEQEKVKAIRQKVSLKLGI